MPTINLSGQIFYKYFSLVELQFAYTKACKVLVCWCSLAFLSDIADLAISYQAI